MKIGQEGQKSRNVIELADSCSLEGENSNLLLNNSQYEQIKELIVDDTSDLKDISDSQDKSSKEDNQIHLFYQNYEQSDE